MHNLTVDRRVVEQLAENTEVLQVLWNSLLPHEIDKLQISDWLLRFDADIVQRAVEITAAAYGKKSRGGFVMTADHCFRYAATVARNAQAQRDAEEFEQNGNRL